MVFASPEISINFEMDLIFIIALLALGLGFFAFFFWSVDAFDKI
jgi:hypothetical protein